MFTGSPKHPCRLDLALTSVRCIEFATRYMDTDTLATSDITPCMIAVWRNPSDPRAKSHIFTEAVSWRQTPGLWRETTAITQSASQARLKPQRRFPLILFRVRATDLVNDLPSLFSPLVPYQQRLSLPYSSCGGISGRGSDCFCLCRYSPNDHHTVVI